ncbi:glutathione S-transferase family protein [Novosphingobium sp. AP12]|uniref:glutathione S-transferase family protein n=1 Tax=Novosphingobium sp. AP12 TaxID=1144305 RepID=UPI000272001D|nr:glutathione S-transferase family protein [Novosphingobium sp. AP12]EJL30861.1 glutathione S-transferase [Novosphingobium sp. AP12]
MKLLVSAWYPYQHQANALGQMIGDPIYTREVMTDDGSTLYGPALGPFVALVVEGAEKPVVGLPAIVEMLDRRYPERGFLGGRDPLARSRVRGLSAKVEECFSRLYIGDIASHGEFGRKKWLENSDASQRVLEEVGPRLAVLENYQKGTTSQFLVGENPTLADVLLMAAWWTAEDQGLGDVAAANENLAAWYARNSQGPFRRG